eukprot:Protomagalhaensia_sp_Gyna_25__288@NODE_1135_length_2150_cov_139_575557_g901_i0_p1_GENE_NODE_1135_length_2150_cov_139_575557_g901_i0NODE_1135_length_2150_cov_139_575557_g901_i0_p1_ORF_typecomplete_len539_score113_24PALP/PF00291_25/2_5e58Pyr_redox_2/PF07992_14/2_5e02Pyr_redox_2/PF07992_14/0_99Pyr_redox_2/PF07992_14/6_3FAD_binding_2/PF00890_24/6_3e02FAD_binding_2/PF00890_24/2_7FAD_binding_2/PF00890_24/3_2Thi4/PF01946_17/0_085Thi4/PF01946_17/24NAD_binding_8/PF13450_6/0_64NAD_binding_8/PF13450_6/70Py
MTTTQIRDNVKIPHLSTFHLPVDEALCNTIASRKRYDRRVEILPSVLDAVGETPLISLRRLCDAYGVSKDTEILGKVEFFNIGGSIKDRPARAMVDYETEHGTLPADGVVIEASSGNTGIGLAVVAAAQGKGCLVTMPETIAYEKEQILRVLGSDVVRTPRVPWFDPRSHLGEASHQEHLLQPRAKFINQYQHPANSASHYVETAQEIIDQTGGQLDFLVVGMGTAGTAAGLAQRMRKDVPNCKVVVFEPEGSIIGKLQDRELSENRPPLGSQASRPIITEADPLTMKLLGEVKPWKIEGIGHDFLPPFIDTNNIDRWDVIPDKEAFEVARTTIKKEGLLIGGSCGAALAAAIRLAKGEGKGKRIVVILADSARNYLSTFLDDGWMLLNGLMSIQEIEVKQRQPEQDDKPLSELLPGVCESVTVPSTVSCEKALSAACNGQQFIKVVDNEVLIGVLSVSDLTKTMMKNPQWMEKSILFLVSPASRISLKPGNTWKQALHVVDEMERVQHLQHGHVLVNGEVLCRRDFMQRGYPIKLPQ